MHRVVGSVTGGVTGVLGWWWLQRFNENKEKELERQDKLKQSKKGPEVEAKKY